MAEKIKMIGLLKMFVDFDREKYLLLIQKAAELPQLSLCKGLRQIKVGVLPKFWQSDALPDFLKTGLRNNLNWNRTLNYNDEKNKMS